MGDLSDDFKPTTKQDLQPGALYKKGDFIGQKYEVYGVLGMGGCGVVYLVYSHEVGEVFALKTFKDEFLADQEVRKRFHKEASVWVELGRHPYLVNAYFVEEISGRLYIEMEYVAPNEEGLNSLNGYLERQPPDLAQSLCWAVQICHGMECAYSRGLRAHRDLKPANIMITQDKTAKVTDFGLAGVLTDPPATSAAGLSAHLGRSGPTGRTMLGTGFGTPAYMPPEQFDNAANCDERSDIYSFGIVLYQMAAGGRLPFPAPVDADWQAMRQLHRESAVPRLDSPLFPIIQRCLEKSPGKRYQTFKEVRASLAPLLQHQTSEVIIPPQLEKLEAWEWSNKGASLHSLGRNEEAIRCCDKALELDPRDFETWTNKGASLRSLGRNEEAIQCYDKALELDPRHTLAWTNKGASLGSLGRYQEEIRCYDEALELDPRHTLAWTNKGASLESLGLPEDAIHCYDRALKLDPSYVKAWYNKGTILTSLGRPEDAILCYDQALELDPRFVSAWDNKGSSLDSLGRPEDAIFCYDRALELDSRYVRAWISKGSSLDSLGRYQEAVCSNDEALKLDPRNADAWFNKGISLNKLGNNEEAVRCFDKALESDPHNADAWYYKALTEDMLGYSRDAARSYRQLLTFGTAKHAKEIQIARDRIEALRGR